MTYDYECPSCGVFEHVQSITSDRLETCPTCTEPVTRLISAQSGGFRLVSGPSGGWARDGYSLPEGKRWAEKTLGRRLLPPNGGKS